MNNPEVQAAFDRLKRLRQHHSPRVVYSLGDKGWLLTYAEINKLIREDERVVLEWHLDNSAGMNILTGTTSDDEPWTDEWLESVGFGVEKINGWALKLPTDNERAMPVILWLDHECRASLVQGYGVDADGNDHVSITSAVYSTKGEVRRLCESLGRKLED